MATDSSVPLYTWKALSHQDSIRVLTLYPSTSKLDDIHITIHEVRLSNSPHYEALSYSWATDDGDDAMSSTIYCDQKLLPVTKNCEAALRKLRVPMTRVLWIDAICINQVNLDERGHQVGMMRSVYKNAYSVPIYLGEPIPEVCEETGKLISDVVVEFLSAFEDEMEDLGKMNRQQLIDSSNCMRNLVLQARAKSVARKSTTPLIQGLQDIFARRWWQRIWVVQEVSLARRCEILWGEKSIWHDTLRRLHQYVLILGDVSVRVEFHTVEIHLFAIQQECHIPEGVMSAVLLARRLQASDPRDKIYGLAGIMDPNHSIIPLPDYNRSSAEVFALVTRNLIETLKTLNILYYTSELGTSCGPSWVVDFSIPSVYRKRDFSRGVMCAAGTSEPFQPPYDDQRLIATGKVVDEVGVVSLLHQIDENDLYGIIGSWRNICRLGLSMEDYLIGQSIKGVLGFMFSDEREDYDDPDMEDCSRQFDELYALLMSDKSTMEIGFRIFHNQTGNMVMKFVMECAGNLVACTTRKKYFGLVPRKTQAGDKIVLLSGGNLPFIVRPVDGYYKLVGGCYIHGIMKGEAWPEDEKDLVKIELR